MLAGGAKRNFARIKPCGGPVYSMSAGGESKQSDSKADETIQPNLKAGIDLYHDT